VLVILCLRLAEKVGIAEWRMYELDLLDSLRSVLSDEAEHEILRLEEMGLWCDGTEFSFLGRPIYVCCLHDAVSCADPGSMRDFYGGEQMGRWRCTAG
jgi:hypothetical protein